MHDSENQWKGSASQLGETRRLTHVKLPGDLFFQNDVSSGTGSAIIPSYCKYGLGPENI